MDRHIISIDPNNIIRDENDNDIDKLRKRYYNISYNFNNIDQYSNDILAKFNIREYDYASFSGIFPIHQYNNGIVVLNWSNINNNVITKLNELNNKYKNVTLNKLYDNYIIHFNGIEQKQIDITNNIRRQLAIDLIEQIRINKLLNLPRIINNKQFERKIMRDINYISDTIKQSQLNYYTGEHINQFDNYEIELYNESKQNDIVNYTLEQINNEISNTQLHYLDKLNKHINKQMNL